MAKIKVKPEEGEQPIISGESPEVEGGSIEENNAPEVVTAEEKVEVTEVTDETKKVKIHTLEDIDCLIAGNMISIRKDKDTEVSSDVAAILCYSKKAYRL